RWSTTFWCHSGPPASRGPTMSRKRGRPMTTAAIYARVSSARQAKDETIGSQLAAVTGHAERQGLDVPPGWVFTDDGHSGASLVRPGLERVRGAGPRGPGVARG